MIYYTADPHFGHENIIRMCDRPFNTVDEMDDCMMTLWNETVTNADTVYIIGDLTFKSKHGPEWYLSRLKGKKILMIGNHDRNWCAAEIAHKYLREVHNLHYIHDGKEQVVLYHYPMMSWPHMIRAYMIFGHIHNNTDAEYWKLIRQNPRMLNAGVEINQYMPVTLDTLIQSNERFKEQHP